MNKHSQPLNREQQRILNDLELGHGRAERLVKVFAQDTDNDLDSYFADLAEGYWHEAAHAQTWDNHMKAQAVALFIETHCKGLAQKFRQDLEAFEQAKIRLLDQSSVVEEDE